jgi:hypothetical protein
MDVLISLALLTNLAEQFGGRYKCECDRTGLDRNPRQYMKIGYPGGEPFWCEECPDIPPEAVYLNNSHCRVKGCNGTTVWALIGTRDDGLCGPHHKKLSEEEQASYKDVKSKRCECDGCDNRAINAIVPEGETYKTTSPTHCGDCVKKLPKEEQRTYENVVSKRCERDECKKQARYAEDFKGFPVKFCGQHAPTHFVHTSMKPCRGTDDGTGCPRDNTIDKRKSESRCAWCDPNGNAKKYEIAVLDRLKELGYGFTCQYKIYDAVDVSKRVRRDRIFQIDGVILFDGIVVAIEVDEKGGHHQDEADERRMCICDEYLVEEHGVDVAWIRIVPNVMGGEKVLGKGNDQFGEKAVKIREEIVDVAAAQIEKLLENPASGEFYFKQL